MRAEQSNIIILDDWRKTRDVSDPYERMEKAMEQCAKNCRDIKRDLDKITSLLQASQDTYSSE